MDSSPVRGVTFCRFGYDESLTLDRVVQLIERKELWSGELLQIDGGKEWTAARDVPQLRPYFGDGGAPPVDRRQRRPYERGERPPFRAAFTEDDGSVFEATGRGYIRLFGALVLIFTFALLSPAIRKLSVEARAPRWPKTTGVALRASVDDSGAVDVTYEYVVDRAHYRAKDTTSSVRRGDEVVVRYSPQQPAASTLAAGIRGSTVSAVLTGFLLLSIAVVLMIAPKAVTDLLYHGTGG